MAKISLADIPGICVGHVTDERALTGCTAVVFPEGAVAGHVACGVASGSRELAALTPRHLVERVHAVCLSGGSAFGLAAAGGVMRRLEAAGIGHVTTWARVPIVAGAVVYDLNLGDGSMRPGEAMGERAAAAALDRAAPASGNVGAGTGACAGKLFGPACATKTGLGNAGLRTGEGLLVAALAVVNPVGDVLDPATGRILAGARRAPDSDELVGSASAIRGGARCAPLGEHHTTLAVVATNAALTRVEAQWVAEQAAVAIARLIDPPFTRHDGDVVFCAAVGDQRVGGDGRSSATPAPGHAAPQELHRVGLLARDALGCAIVDACRSAAPAGGLPSCHGLRPPT